MDFLRELSHRIHWFFEPDNPFVPWLLIIDLLLLLGHVYLIYWVYRDALWRYNRGAPWAMVTALLPLAGWMFYLFYRKSPLVELDREDAEIFDESEHEWTDYDQYKANQSAQMFRELNIFRKREGGGYSPWIQRSREKELGRPLTAEEKKALRQQRQQKALEARQARIEAKKNRVETRRQKALQRREDQKKVGAHGSVLRMSERKQKQMQQKLALMEQLKALPREDQVLEDLIYEMKYAEALTTARGNLALAEEAQDNQGIVTARAYIDRLERLISEG
ncbi:hypothetical protein IT575_15500 [bacterium]|nr:hypothetical protein [bacterium]